MTKTKQRIYRNIHLNYIGRTKAKHKKESDAAKESIEQ